MTKKKKPEKVDTRPVAAGIVLSPEARRGKLPGKRFVFTVAQNNTYAHKPFLKSLLNFCGDKGARLVISKTNYNKNGFQNATKDSDGLWYDPEVVPYLLPESMQVAKDLVWCGELDILPTAERPLSGFENYTRHASAIVPHTKVHMSSMPVMQGTAPRFLYTTGAVTLRNYIQRKAGQKAEFHHVFGALYVEVDAEGDWFARQLIADDTGTFYDLDGRYTSRGVSHGHRVEAINWGDIHAELLDVDVDAGCFQEGGMLDELKPKYQFIHDLSDFRPRNHHNIRDPYFLADQAFNGINSVEAGILASHSFLVRAGREGCRTIVVESNHDQALKRWLMDDAGHMDAVNARYWHDLNAWIFGQIENGEVDPHVFREAVLRFGKLAHTSFLKEDDTFTICGNRGRLGIECGMHGHRGPNGSRGSARALRSIGRRCNVGHAHSSGIIDGVYVAGVSATLKMGYNRGPTSWSHSHIATYPHGKRAIITMKGSKWRA